MICIVFCAAQRSSALTIAPSQSGFVAGLFTLEASEARSQVLSAILGGGSRASEERFAVPVVLLGVAARAFVGLGLGHCPGSAERFFHSDASARWVFSARALFTYFDDWRPLGPVLNFKC